MLSTLLTPNESVANPWWECCQPPDESVANQFFCHKIFFFSKLLPQEKNIFFGQTKMLQKWYAPKNKSQHTPAPKTVIDRSSIIMMIAIIDLDRSWSSFPGLHRQGFVSLSNQAATQLCMSVEPGCDTAMYVCGTENHTQFGRLVRTGNLMLEFDFEGLF